VEDDVTWQTVHNDVYRLELDRGHDRMVSR